VSQPDTNRTRTGHGETATGQPDTVPIKTYCPSGLPATHRTPTGHSTGAETVRQADHVTAAAPMAGRASVPGRAPANGSALSERLRCPEAVLSRTDLTDLGYTRRAVDDIFRHCPVIVLPDFSRPLIKVADYLEAYATQFELPVRSGTRVDAVSKEGERYIVTTGEQTFEAENVVVATGVMQEPIVPSFAPELDPRIRQLHSSDYRHLSQLQEGAVLVVGASHSGADIAYETAAEHETILSGPDTGQIPASVETRRGRAGFRVWLFIGTHLLTMDTPLGRKMRPHIRHGGAPLLRYRKKDLAAAGVERVLAKTTTVQDGKPVLADGRVLDVQNVIWCTGFRRDDSWIKVPYEVDEDDYPEQYRGVVDSAPGLYFVGMLFLHSFASMLIAGAGRDAERVAKHIAAKAKGRPASAQDRALEAVA
jgi:putative flavoprotein involved in K+ transport